MFQKLNPLLKQLKNSGNRSKKFILRVDNIMIDNKQNIKAPNTQLESILTQQQQKTPKANSQQPHFQSQQPKFQDDLYQQPPKVLRNSSSQYDSVLQNFYKKQQQNDAKSTFKQGKNQRETRQQISFIIDKAQKGVTAAYFVATKQSNSGVFSHQRFFVVDIIAKQIKYYTNTPRLPLKSIQEIVEKPKQCIKFSQAKKISVSNLKKGIGQLQIRWTQNSQTKEWKLKLGNNVMAKQLTILIDSLKTGKPVTVEDKQKSKEKIMKDLNSPRNQNNSLNKNWISVIKKENSSVSRAEPSNLSNLLLQSMLNPNEKIVQKNKEAAKKEKVKIENLKPIQKRDQDISVVKVSPKNGKVEKNLKIESFILNQNIVKAVELKSQHQNKEKQKEENIQVKENDEVKEKEHKQKQIIQTKNEQTLDSPYKNLQMSKQQNKNASPLQENITQANKSIYLKLETKLSSIKSIKFQQIIQNATIQYQQRQKKQHKQLQVIPISIINIEKPRKSQLEAVIQRRKQIEEQSAPTQRTINNKQQLQMSKIIVKNIFKNTTESKTLELSRKKSANEQKLKQSRHKQEINYYQSTVPPKKQSLRQNLLQERKYAQSIQATDKREAKIMNTHSHPRKQRSRSNSASNKIEDYIQKQKQQKEHQKQWLLKWLTTQNSNERGILYKKIVDEYKQKVEGLSKKFNSWHLFHKEGEEYIVKEGQIEMQYVMSTSIDGQGECQSIETFYARKFNQLSYLWNMTGAGKQLNKQYKIVIAPTCIVNYKGLKVFCKLDINQTRLNFRDVSYLRQYEELMSEISRKCHYKVKSIQLYELILGNKKYLYVESIQVQPSIQKPLNYFLNQVYVNNYVAGVITLENHLQKIHYHFQTFIVPQPVTLLQTFTPLSNLQLQSEMAKLGMDRSAFPMVYMYCKLNQKKRENKFIISELCAQIISQNIRRDIHKILLSKVPEKNIEEQIYSLLMKNLRMDDPNFSHSLQLRYHLKISIQQIRDNIVEQYLITSLLIKLGIKCNLKEDKIELKQLQKKMDLFWQQFQFNLQTVSFKWENKTNYYSSIPLQQQSNYFENLFFPKRTVQQQNKVVYDRKHLLEKLVTSQSKSYNESWVFLLLNESQQELIKSIIAREQPILPIAQWEYQQHLFYHLKYKPLLYYCTYSSFENVIIGLRHLIRKGEYQNAHNLLEVQLVRAWIWGSQNPKLLVTILHLKSELNQLMCKEIESIESTLQGLRISIKYYQLSAFKLQNVLNICKKAAQIHVRYRKYRKAIEFYQTCMTLFQKAVEQSQKILPLFNNNITIYSQRMKVYLKLGDYLKVEESVKQNMATFFRWKEQLQHQNPDVLSIIYRQQFQCYSLLFRVYQIRRKYIDLVQLMEDCSVKFIQNYLQLMIEYDKKVTLDSQQIYQYSQILKNIWIAVIANSNHDKIPSYQQYFNYYYSPLRNLKLDVVKDILLKIRKMHKVLAPQQKQQSLDQLMCLLAIKIKQNKQKQQSMENKRVKSILIVGIIDCLSLLSISKQTFLQTKGSYELSQVIMLQKIVSILGFEFTIGVIQAYSQDYNLQL